LRLDRIIQINGKIMTIENSVKKKYEKRILIDIFLCPPVFMMLRFKLCSFFNN